MKKYIQFILYKFSTLYIQYKFIYIQYIQYMHVWLFEYTTFSIEIYQLVPTLDQIHLSLLLIIINILTK